MVVERESKLWYDSDVAFDENLLLQQFLRNNITRWNNEGISSELRWIETLKAFNNEGRPINQISTLVKYAYAIPGTSTTVERLFSMIKDVWGPEKGQMHLSTLEAVLTIKVNSNLGCMEYYSSIKNNKKLLAQVQSGDKYEW